MIISRKIFTSASVVGSLSVNVTLRNIDPFFQAFSIPEGQPMYRPAADRVIIW